jgi:hypothetical protein
MPTTPANVSVTIPVTQAIERVKLLLFRPFDLGKWFTIGFCAWLAHLGETGFQARYNFGSPHSGEGQGVREVFEHAREYVLANLFWILPLAAALFLIGLAIGVLFCWLRSRGQFMFLHCVALNQAEIGEPWHKFTREGNSLFLFRLGLAVAGMIPMLPLLVLVVVVIMRMADRGAPDAPGMLTLIAAVFMLIAVGMAFFVIAKLTTDFAVPIMFLRGATCLESWKELLGLISCQVPGFVLYLLFQVVLAMAVGVIVVMAIFATCCIAGCLMILPYLGAVVLLPVSIFKRSYSLHYLAQYGREYDVFPPPMVTTIPGVVPPPAAG